MGVMVKKFSVRLAGSNINIIHKVTNSDPLIGRAKVHIDLKVPFTYELYDFLNVSIQLSQNIRKRIVSERILHLQENLSNA